MRLLQLCVISLIIINSITLTQTYSASTFKSNESTYEEFVTEDTIILYYGTALLEYEKEKINNRISLLKHINVHTHAPVYHIDPNLTELKLKIIVNYTAKMNFTAGFPYVILSPLVAFGLKVENYTDFIWESFKLKHYGYAKCEGNISVEISFDMENIESGDKIILQPSVIVIGDPGIFISKDFPRKEIFTSILMRFCYNLPSSILKERLLHNLILPFFSPYNTFDSIEIKILFD